MATRMEKYHTDSTNNQRRFERNSHLYQEINTNKVYTEFTNVSNNAIRLDDISSNAVVNKREDYQKNRVFNQEESVNVRKPYLEEKKERFSLEEQDYNINDILENARKNRQDLNEEEKKRHLKTVEYNILTDLNQEKEQKDKNKKLSKQEEENLEELIHTITSNSLRKKIDDELLSELMPSEESESIISEQLLDEIKDLEEDEEEKNELEDTMDKSFYTKSMDLSEEDFEFNEEEEADQSFLEESKMSSGKKVLICLFVIIIMAIIGFVIWQFI